MVHSWLIFVFSRGAQKRQSYFQCSLLYSITSCRQNLAQHSALIYRFINLGHFTFLLTLLKLLMDTLDKATARRHKNKKIWERRKGNDLCMDASVQTGCCSLSDNSPEVSLTSCCGWRAAVRLQVWVTCVVLLIQHYLRKVRSIVFLCWRNFKKYFQSAPSQLEHFPNRSISDFVQNRYTSLLY